MINLNPTLTVGGLALFTGQSPGFSVVITHVAFGAEKYDPLGYESSLKAELARFPIDGSALISPSSIQVGVLMKNAAPNGATANNKWIGEIGFYAGDTLFAVLSQAAAYLFYKSPDIDIPVTYVLDFSVLPPGSITVNNDALSSSIALSSSYAQTAAKTALDVQKAITSSYYGAYAVAPATRPDGSARQHGDRYFDAVERAELTWNGLLWYTPNIDTADLATPAGARKVGTTLVDGGAAMSVEAALRAVHGLALGGDFDTVKAAGAVAPEDLFIIRQGLESKKIKYSSVRADLVAATESQTGLAVAARLAAEAARDAAKLTASVYATTAAGLAATPAGQHFSVAAADSREFLILYRNNAGVAVEVKRYPSTNGVAAMVEPVMRAVFDVAGVGVAARNTNGTLATVGTMDWVNPPPVDALVDCDVPSIKEKFLVDKWVRFKANVGYSDGGTANSVYFRVPYGAAGEKIPAGKWVQQAMLVHLPNGGAWPEMRAQLLWDVAQFLYPVFQYIEVDEKTRIVYSTAQVTVGTSTLMLVGSQWGKVANDWCVGACYAQVFDREPAGLQLSLSRVTLNSRIGAAEGYIAQDKVDKINRESVVDGLILKMGVGNEPINKDWALSTGKPDFKWINAPAQSAIVPCHIPSVAERFGLVNWLKYTANVGLSDGGTTNSIYLAAQYDANNSDIPVGKWIQQAFILHTPTGAIPDLKGHFVWDTPLQTFPDFNVISIDATTKIIWSVMQVSSAGHKSLLVGSQFGVKPFDFYVGGWAVQVYDEKPASLLISVDKSSFTSKVARLEQELASGVAFGADWKTVNFTALGDSITWGAGSSGGARGWADILHAAVKFKSFTKLAVNGASAMPIAGRTKLSDEVAAIPAGTSLITVLIGLNDFNLGNPLGDVAAVLAKPYETLDQTASFAEAFRFNLETIRRNFPVARVVVVLPLQTRWGRSPNPDGKTLKDFRDVERAVAQALAIPVLEAQNDSGIWSGGPHLPDGGHPNDAGYEMIAGYMRRKLGSV